MFLCKHLVSSAMRLHFYCLKNEPRRRIAFLNLEEFHW